jgi:hypothetical protein
MKSCPDCGGSSPDVAIFCWRCSADLDAPAAPRAAPGEDPDTRQRFKRQRPPAPAEPAAGGPPEPPTDAGAPRTCEQCGYALQRDARFCNECGAHVSA